MQAVEADSRADEEARDKELNAIVEFVVCSCGKATPLAEVITALVYYGVGLLMPSASHGVVIYDAILHWSRLALED